MKATFLVIALCVAAIPAAAQNFIGVVTGNHDGDTPYVSLQSG
jgi:hypothetical protein